MACVARSAGLLNRYRRGARGRWPNRWGEGRKQEAAARVAHDRRPWIHLIGPAARALMRSPPVGRSGRVGCHRLGLCGSGRRGPASGGRRGCGDRRRVRRGIDRCRGGRLRPGRWLANRSGRSRWASQLLAVSGRSRGSADRDSTGERRSSRTTTTRTRTTPAMSGNAARAKLAYGPWAASSRGGRRHPASGLR